MFLNLTFDQKKLYSFLLFYWTFKLFHSHIYYPHWNWNIYSIHHSPYINNNSARWHVALVIDSYAHIMMDDWQCFIKFHKICYLFERVGNIYIYTAYTPVSLTVQRFWQQNIYIYIDIHMWISICILMAMMTNNGKYCYTNCSTSKYWYWVRTQENICLSSNTYFTHLKYKQSTNNPELEININTHTRPHAQ